MWARLDYVTTTCPMNQHLDRLEEEYSFEFVKVVVYALYLSEEQIIAVAKLETEAEARIFGVKVGAMAIDRMSADAFAAHLPGCVDEALCAYRASH